MTRTVTVTASNRTATIVGSDRTVTVGNDTATVDVVDGIQRIADALDTAFTSIADNDIVAYDSGSGKYINQSLSEVGAASAATLAAHEALADEHIDWSASGAGTIHSTNYTDTTYTNSSWDHDQLTNFVSGEHFLQSAISITKSQVSDFGSYLPLAGGTITGDLTINSQLALGSTASITTGESLTLSETYVPAFFGDAKSMSMKSNISTVNSFWTQTVFNMDVDVLASGATGAARGLNIEIKNSEATNKLSGLLGIRIQMLGASNCDSIATTGILIENALFLGSGSTDALSGIKIQKQTEGVLNYGIILNGDDKGADIVFGASQNVRQHFNGTVLEFEGAGITYTATTVTNTGSVSIAINGTTYKFMVST